MSINVPNFDDLSCMFGPLVPESRKRLQALLDHPCEGTWDDAYRIVIHEDWLTLWRAVTIVDPVFCGAIITRWDSDAMGNYTKSVSQWTCIPTRDAILQALRYAAS